MSGPNESERLERLLGYRRHDPGNEALAIECAETALAAGQPDLTLELLGELAAAGTLEGENANRAAIAAMRAGDQQGAQAWFRSLLEVRPDDTSLRFNLAWSLALDGDREDALATLDPTTVTALPQAAMLDLQLRHEAGQWDEAAELIQRYLANHPDYPPLQAAAAVLAMDLDDIELARRCALQAGDHPDALATLGMLALGDDDPAQAGARFAQSLATRELRNPRARIGLGLVDLAEGRTNEAAERLDAGAREFADHLGSWIAAGWAHALAGNLAAARERFEQAMSLDDTFAEAHGSLAAIEALQGDAEAARGHLKVALRLDRQSFSGALAGVLLAAGEGDAERARQVFEAAMKQPVMPGGKTLGAALAAMAR